MNKWILLGMMAVSSPLLSVNEVVLSYEMSHQQKDLGQPVNVVQIDQVAPEVLQEIVEGKHPEIAIEFPKYFRVPLKMIVLGEFFSLYGEEKSERFLKIDHTFYLRMVDTTLCMSKDLKKWKPFTEFLTGQLSAQYTVEEGSLTIRLKVNERQN